MYNAYVTRIKNLRPHSNADRLQLGDCFGNTVCIGLEIVENQLGVYFPTDGCFSKEFGEANNLFRKKDAEGNEVGGYIDPIKRNIRAIRLRGEKSDGIFLPIECLESFGNISKLKEGDIVSTFNGHDIASKYFPKVTTKENYKVNRVRKKDIKIAPLFMEHVDTEQLEYNLETFKTKDEIEITLKMHGTSQRTGYLPVLKEYKRSFFDKIFRREGKPVYEYDYVTGTRRVVLEQFDGGFYGNNIFRKQHHDTFVGKLMKGETVYYEVVGFTDVGAPIMGICENKKVGKDFVKTYGEKTVFSYGCSPDGRARNEVNGEVSEPQSDIYVYRMTITNEDGFVVEYSPDFMRYRCEQIGVKTVPVFEHCLIPNFSEQVNFPPVQDNFLAGDFVKKIASYYIEGADPIGKTHIREGVVVRILNRPKFTAYKYKSYNFKLLEGIIKEDAAQPDMEEIQEVQEVQEV